jgi:hypothetical protein
MHVGGCSIVHSTRVKRRTTVEPPCAESGAVARSKLSKNRHKVAGQSRFVFRMIANCMLPCGVIAMIACAAVQEELRQGIETELSGSCAGGESQRSDRRGDGDARRRLRRARCSAVDACAKARGPLTLHHRGRRQGLRYEGFRAYGTGIERDTALYQEQQRPHQKPGPQNHASTRQCHQPEPAMADRKGPRMAEENRPAAPGAARLKRHGAQSDPDAASDGSTTGNAAGAVCLSDGCEPRG